MVKRLLWFQDLRTASCCLSVFKSGFLKLRRKFFWKFEKFQKLKRDVEQRFTKKLPSKTGTNAESNGQSGYSYSGTKTKICCGPVQSYLVGPDVLEIFFYFCVRNYLIKLMKKMTKKLMKKLMKKCWKNSYATTQTVDENTSTVTQWSVTRWSKLTLK